MFLVSTSSSNGTTPLPRPTSTAPRPPRAIRVAFCGPIGAIGKPAGGGYESANRRNCDALARRGVTVTELPYPKVTTPPIAKLLRYGASFVRAAAFLIWRQKDYDLLHLTPLNMHFALAESWLVACARWVGKPVLLDIRAGTFVRHYDTGSARYRHTIDRSLRLANQVAVEGEAYLAFARQRTLAPVLHFPNYVDGPALRQTPAVRALDGTAPIRLLYFGRLVAEKGIETALSTLVVLLARGHAVELELIGDGPSAFVAELRQRHANLPVTWSAGLPMEAILQRAALAHFFIFASRHDGEGHSNALNEAMSIGLVPVGSDQGFTRSVVGDAGVVLPMVAQASDYAAAIEDAVAARPPEGTCALQRRCDAASADRHLPAHVGRQPAAEQAVAKPAQTPSRDCRTQSSKLSSIHNSFSWFCRSSRCSST
jgi:glycosyltransferase involved in cell wall biosynthesis